MGSWGFGGPGGRGKLEPPCLLTKRGGGGGGGIPDVSVNSALSWGCKVFLSLCLSLSLSLCIYAYIIHTLTYMYIYIYIYIYVYSPMSYVCMYMT